MGVEMAALPAAQPQDPSAGFLLPGDSYVVPFCMGGIP